jgi:hypothetical protein
MMNQSQTRSCTANFRYGTSIVGETSVKLFQGILQPHILREVGAVLVLVIILLNHLIRLIDAHLSSMNYDANKLPLGIDIDYYTHHVRSHFLPGKLAKSTILNGFAALKVRTT